MIRFFLSGLALALGVLTSLNTMAEIRSDKACGTETFAPASTSEAQLAFRDLGPDDGSPVLLIGGTDQQFGQWPKTLIDGLQRAGHRVILYEARDVGCSTHHVEEGAVDWMAVFAALKAGDSPRLAYGLPDLAADAVALLDHLEIGQADVIGVSGGATVAGELAAIQPQRVNRLVLVMANSGNPERPIPAQPERMASVPPPPPADAKAEAVVSWRTAAWSALGSELTPEIEEIARSATLRSWDPDGTARSGAALLVAGDRRMRLKSVEAPSLVIHGAEDPLVSREAALEVANAIPHAAFLLIPEMGHNLSSAAIEAILGGLARRAEAISVE